MSDPRIPALAEALASLGDGLDDIDDKQEWYDTPRDLAVAILAALPPDWCGHEAELDGWLQVVNLAGEQMLEMEAEIARLRAEIAVWRDNDVGAMQRELARRGRIEEAARAYLSRPSSPALLAALRAALEKP